MKDATSIIIFFKSHFGVVIPPKKEDFIIKLSKKEIIKKKKLLFMEGDANTRHYIIEKGLLRLYLINSKGKEINILFAKENQVIGDLSTPQATNFFLETIEDSVVYSFTETQLHKILEYLKPDTDIDLAYGIRKSYLHIQKRLVAILSKSAEDNYLEFRVKHPDLIQRLPQYQIAAYLGITHEFLSKIITKIAKNK